MATVSLTELQEAFDRAASRSATLVGKVLAVEPIDRGGALMAAVNADGGWALAIRSLPDPRRTAPVNLEVMSAEFGVRCTLSIDDSNEDVRVSIIRLNSIDSDVRRLFMSFVAALMEELPTAPSESQVARAINGWMGLFLELQTPGRKDVIGLIGELAFLDAVADKASWVKAWHGVPTDNMDFSFEVPLVGVEVKATTGRERVHVLSLYQASGPDGEDRYFASVLVELRESGTLVSLVAQEIADTLIAEEDRRHFWRAITSVCGASFGEFMRVRYMREAARQGLKLFAGTKVPQPSVALPLPVGVSDVHFRSDFSSVQPVLLADMNDLLGIQES